MILALTLNPSIDISYPLETLKLNTVNRASNVKKTAGGKGLNVARVIKMGNHHVVATGFIGGNIGQYILSLLDLDKIPHDFLSISTESRNCIAILHENCQTEILEPGPEIKEEDQIKFKSHFTSLLAQSNIITISGSLPKGIPNNYYSEIIEIANKQNKKVLLDCSGSTLSYTLKQKELPYLIKPNQEELEAILGEKVNINDHKTIKNILLHNELFNKIPVIVISLGKNGAIAKTDNDVWKLSIPNINAVNPVGSGDSTIAGLAMGLDLNEGIETILKRAMTFGMLNALESGTGMINLNNYDELFNQITIHEI